MPVPINMKNFDFVNLTQAVNQLAKEATYVGLLDAVIPFTKKPVQSTTIGIGKVHNGLTIVSDKPRNSSDSDLRAGRAEEIVYFDANHFMIEGMIDAQSYQDRVNIMTGKPVSSINEEIVKQFNNDLVSLNARINQLKFGAIKGLVIDENGTTTKDLYNEFNYTRPPTFSLDLTNATVDVSAVFRNIEDYILDNTYGRTVTQQPILLVGSNVFNKLTNLVANQISATTEDVRFINSSELLKRLPFDVMKVHGSYNGVNFIEDDTGYVVPRGVAPNLFEHYIAPPVINSLNLVNKITPLEYYSMRKNNDLNSGVTLYTETNPLIICTDPRMLVKVDFTTS